MINRHGAHLDMVHRSAIRMAEGGILFIEGNPIRAKKVHDYQSCFCDGSPCNICEMDSLCTELACDICNELDMLNRGTWYLELVK